MTRVRLVWDGLALLVPPEMGQARADQLQGGTLDQLTELSGRVCYDSLGVGRDSVAYHAHIRTVNHTSVYEHAVLTVALPCKYRDDADMVYLACLNRPGVWVTDGFHWNDTAKHGAVCVTANLRAVREWASCPLRVQGRQGDELQTEAIGRELVRLFSVHAPLALADRQGGAGKAAQTKPEGPDEIWCSLFFTGVSRGLTHELVRHKWMTGCSQQSSRYVDSSAIPWVPHPLMDAADRAYLELCQTRDRDAYRDIAARMQERLIATGMDQLGARKQARGAARGVLGNALGTELIFSAALSQWQRMFSQRISPAADAEICGVMEEARALLSTRWPEYFPAR